MMRRDPCERILAHKFLKLSNLSQNKVQTRFLAAFCLILALVSMCSIVLAETEENSAIEAHPEAIIKAGEILKSGYQTKLPVKKDTAVIELPSVGFSGAFSQVGLVIMIGLLVVLVVFIFNNNRINHGTTDSLGFTSGDGIDFTTLKIPDPKELASRGDFAGAIHALLLRSLVLTSRHIDSTWPRSLTSREILHHGQLPEAARSDLGRLIKRVEIHHFGGLTPIGDDYSLCQEIYDHLEDNLKGEES